jgi:glycosyltransferase involved in cell wall biosynthesis
MDISIVVPIFNEYESIPELIDWIERVLSSKFSFEVILIDDGSTDGTWQVIENIGAKKSFVRAIKLRRNYGKSAALQCGFQIANGDVVVTMDADLQDSPDEVPELYKMVKENNFDVVSGWKKKRFDPISKTIPTKIYNAALRTMSGIKLHDFNCGLKAYKNEVIKCIEVYGEMHRYIPYMAKKAGFKKIGEKVVTHQKRKYGVTKFGLERFINGPLDMISIMFISKFGKRPMHIFGSLGTLMFILGFLWAGYLGADKLYTQFALHQQAKLVTSSPYFYLAITAMIIGTQLFLAGFLGELVSRSATDRNSYLVEKTLN